ncbi:MAG: ABC transporter permease subunit [Candidatus Dormibacteraeota bacterium]|nr:ABC transporter permease subunit [Candidatus Dormibacteraeota bacterium]
MSALDELPQNGAAPGYRAAATLRVWAEVRREAGRLRTRLALGCMVLLPLIILLAFEIGRPGGNGQQRGAFAAFASLGTHGGLNFALFTLLVSSSFLLVIVVALFCGDCIASEASWGSLRYLLAIPVPRGRLLLNKLLVALVTCAVALILLTGTALLAGTLRYGWHPMLTTYGEQIPTGLALLRLLAILAYIAITLLVTAGLAFLLSVSTDAPLGAVGGAVMLLIVSDILDQITALGALRVVLPTHYADAWLTFLSDPIQWDDVVKGTVSALIYFAAFIAWAWYRFQRKDVVS